MRCVMYRCYNKIFHSLPVLSSFGRIVVCVYIFWSIGVRLTMRFNGERFQVLENIE
jgi:hypothetical protein